MEQSCMQSFLCGLAGQLPWILIALAVLTFLARKWKRNKEAISAVIDPGKPDKEQTQTDLKTALKELGVNEIEQSVESIMLGKTDDVDPRIIRVRIVYSRERGEIVKRHEIEVTGADGKPRIHRTTRRFDYPFSPDEIRAEMIRKRSDEIEKVLYDKGVRT